MPITRRVPTRAALPFAIAIALLGDVEAATLTVNVASDGPIAPNAECTLREAIASISQGASQGGCVASGAFGVADRVQFQANIGSAITLAPGQGPMVLARAAAIAGPGAATLAFDGNGLAGLLDLRADTTVSGLTLRFASGAGLASGGAVAIGGGARFVFRDVTFHDNASLNVGGAIAINAPIEALTVERARFDRNIAFAGDGGAVLARNVGTLVVRDSVFTDNQAFDRGGAIALSEPRAGRTHTLERSTFVGNDAGVEFFPTQPSRLSGVPTPDGDFPLDGGAVYARLNGVGGGLLTINGSTFRANTAPRYGGALFFASDNNFADLAKLDIRDSRIEDNEAFMLGFGDGGALYQRSGDTEIRRSVIAGNLANDEGGAIYNRAGSTLIEDSTFDRNRSASWGGAFASFCGATCIDDTAATRFVMRRSTVSRNRANTEGFDPVASGGGIFLLREPTVIENSTISSNIVQATWNPGLAARAGFARAGNGNDGWALASSSLSGTEPPPRPPFGGGGGALIYTVAIGEIALTLANSTFANNVSLTNRPGTGGTWIVGGFRAGIASSIFDGSIGGRSVDTDLTLTGIEKTEEGPIVTALRNVVRLAPSNFPLCCGNTGGGAEILPLQNNGGPTETHAIDAGSPAYGAGENPRNLATDQRGGAFPRTVDGRTDAGAFQSPTGVEITRRIDALGSWASAALAVLLALVGAVALTRQRGPIRGR